jgi:kynureninase
VGVLEPPPFPTDGYVAQGVAGLLDLELRWCDPAVPAASRDEQSPLRDRRDLFDLPDGVVYLDGNSLGALPRSVAARLQQVVSSEWGHGLISSWNTAGWVDLSRRVGARIAPLVGAEPADVHVGDSTTVTLFKTLTAAMSNIAPVRKSP